MKRNLIIISVVIIIIIAWTLYTNHLTRGAVTYQSPSIEKVNQYDSGFDKNKIFLTTDTFGNEGQSHIETFDIKNYSPEKIPGLANLAEKTKQTILNVYKNFGSAPDFYYTGTGNPLIVVFKKDLSFMKTYDLSQYIDRVNQTKWTGNALLVIGQKKTNIDAEDWYKNAPKVYFYIDIDKTNDKIAPLSADETALLGNSSVDGDPFIKGKVLVSTCTHISTFLSVTSGGYCTELQFSLVDILHSTSEKLLTYSSSTSNNYIGFDDKNGYIILDGWNSVYKVSLQ